MDSCGLQNGNRDAFVVPRQGLKFTAGSACDAAPLFPQKGLDTTSASHEHGWWSDHAAANSKNSILDNGQSYGILKRCVS